MVITSPARQPAAPEVSVARVSDDLFSVSTRAETLGYVRKVGNVFVALRGSIFHHAVEVGQSLSADRAVQFVHSA